MKIMILTRGFLILVQVYVKHRVKEPVSQTDIFLASNQREVVPTSCRHNLLMLAKSNT